MQKESEVKTELITKNDLSELVILRFARLQDLEMLGRLNF
jgi:hypothetical protein